MAVIAAAGMTVATGVPASAATGPALAGSSIHLMSNIDMQLDQGSTITATSTGYDPAEPNAHDQYQDYGHSHFHDSVIWGENLTNVAFTGSGTITGAGHLITGTPKTGQADKLLTLSPIMEKIGTRLRCGGSPPAGSISDIHYNDVTGTSAGAYSPTLWGQPGHPITGITFNDVNLTLPGGHGAMDPNAVPADNGDYNPDSLSTPPAYGFYLHNVSGTTFNDGSMKLAANDERPAFIANTGSDITLNHVALQPGGGSPFDAGFQGVSGYCLAGTRTTTGAALRVSTPGSTRAPGRACTAGLNNFALSVIPAGVTVTGGVTFSVSDLSVADAANAANWSIQQDTQAGKAMYGDRTIALATVPQALQGATWIRTANSSKSATENPLATFTINAPATVAVAVDTRLGRCSDRRAA